MTAVSDPEPGYKTMLRHFVREPCRGGTPEASDGRLAYKNNLLKEHNRERDRLRKDARQTRDDRRNND